MSWGTRGMNVAEKLDHYTYPEPNTGCWLWGGTTNATGYGRLRLRDKKYSAHRLQWERHFGVIPEGMFVCHRCDVPSCVNPEHLFLGTAKDNMQDAISKGRINNAGINNGESKLTDYQVIEIFNDDRIQEVIASHYGVARTTVSHIKTGKRWRYLNLQPPDKS